jgi:hypothetical protein
MTVPFSIHLTIDVTTNDLLQFVLEESGLHFSVLRLISRNVREGRGLQINFKFRSIYGAMIAFEP